MRDVAKYLNSKQSVCDEDLAAAWAKLESLYNKKLWHQLTIELLDFIKHPSLQANDELVHMYENFVADFENKYVNLFKHFSIFCFPFPVPPIPLLCPLFFA